MTSKIVEDSEKKLPPAAGKGRPKGAVNKTTALLKDAILQAAERAGNKVGKDGLISYLEQQATDNPAPFLSLLGKVLPIQVAGDPDAPLQTVTRIEIVPLTGHDSSTN